MKPPFVDYNMYVAVSKLPSPHLEEFDDTKAIVASSQTMNRSGTIVTNYIGHWIAVYNGKSFKKIFIKEGMVGHKLGEFVWTKKLGASIHNSDRNRKRKEKMRRKITMKKVRKPKTDSKAKTKTTKKNKKK